MGHINIPIFIPHLGCPNQCIFCNQKYISGTLDFSDADVEEKIQDVLSTVGDEKPEIAFFGGSFTGIDRRLMIKLLNVAQKYIDKGYVSAIRMSTRPDYISEDILDILQNYTVSCVELGIQSMNDDILSYLKRGHTASDTVNAVKLLKEKNIPFVGQMMIGLPKSTPEDEIRCAEFICENGACASRIYPTLVFKQTELEQITNSGEYSPLSLDEAISRSADVLEVFVRHGVPCIRIGLCESENLHSEETFVAGPNHPSIGEMVKSRFYLKQIISKINNLKTSSKSITIMCPIGALSQIIGNKKSNVDYIKTQYGFERVKVTEDSLLEPYHIKIESKEG